MAINLELIDLPTYSLSTQYQHTQEFEKMPIIFDIPFLRKLNSEGLSSVKGEFFYKRLVHHPYAFELTVTLGKFRRTTPKM